MSKFHGIGEDHGPLPWADTRIGLPRLICQGLCYNGCRDMIRSFANRGSEDLFNGLDSRAARATCPRQLWSTVYRKFDQLNCARGLTDLAVPPGNRLELLQGDRAGQYSIRINEQYRVCFRWEDHCAEEVEVTDYH